MNPEKALIPEQPNYRNIVVNEINDIRNEVHEKTRSLSRDERLEYYCRLEMPLNHFAHGIRNGSIHVFETPEKNIDWEPAAKFDVGYNRHAFYRGLPNQTSDLSKMPIFFPHETGDVLFPTLSIAANYADSNDYFTSDIVGASVAALRSLAQPKEFSERYGMTVAQAARSQVLWERLRATRPDEKVSVPPSTPFSVEFINEAVERIFGRNQRLLDFGARDVQKVLPGMDISNKDRAHIQYLLQFPLQFVLKREYMMLQEEIAQHDETKHPTSKTVEYILQKKFGENVHEDTYAESDELYEDRRETAARLFVYEIADYLG